MAFTETFGRNPTTAMIPLMLPRRVACCETMPRSNKGYVDLMEREKAGLLFSRGSIL